MRGITAAQQNVTHGNCSGKLRDTEKTINRNGSTGFN